MAAEKCTPSTEVIKHTPRPSILVVDDNVALCGIVCEILDAQGYTTSKALSADEAMRILKTTTPNLILTDLMMPDVSGMTLISRLRLEPSLSSVPIIVLSAKAAKEDREAAHRAGANAFLVKPFSNHELRDLINRFLPSKVG
jgi:adenylate cyclase